MFSIIIVIVLIGTAIFFVEKGNVNQPNEKNPNDTTNTQPVRNNNVTVVDGKQIITIDAKGGYFPHITKAKADMPTILKVTTRGTFDCSSALTIPDIDYKNNLPPSGVTEITIPPQKAGAKIQGLCTMGMYNFKIEFE